MYDVYVIGFGGGDVRGCQAVVRPNTSKPPTPPEQNKNCHKIYRTRFGTTHRQKAIDRPLSAFALDKKKFQSKALALSLSLQLPAAATNHISTMGAEQSIELPAGSGASNQATTTTTTSPRSSPRGIRMSAEGVPTLFYTGHELCIARHKEQRRRYRNMMTYGGSKAATMD